MSQQNDGHHIILCPWCEEEQEIEAVPENMILAFNCDVCYRPIVVIQDLAIKVDQHVLDSGDLSLLKNYIAKILQDEFGLPVDQLELDITEIDNHSKPEKNTPISDDEIKRMRHFLNNFKIPRDGQMFDSES